MGPPYACWATRDKGLGFLGKNENGEPTLAPRLNGPSIYAVAAPRGRCLGAHRKSGVVIQLTYAWPVES
jgi:hypothetical protein